MADRDALVEELVFESFERLAGGGELAVDKLLAGQPDDIREQVRETMALLQRLGLAEQTATEAAPPDRLGPYELLERVGSGAMGVVYRARRSEDPQHQELAVKVLQPGLLPVRVSRSRFEREIAALRQMDHPGICPILDDGEFGGVPFLVMPFVAGPSLRAAGNDRSPGSRTQFVQAIEQVARALHHAHEHGFVHRDVKPGNVILQPDGRAMLLDFGLARLDRGDVEGSLTGAGGVVGTPAYMAPEQVAGRSDVDRRADVYALGVMLYELLTGRLPYEAPTRESLYRRILNADLQLPSRLERGVASAWDAVCATALARDPARRYQTAELLADDLVRVIAGERPIAQLPGRVERTINWTRRYPVVTTLMSALAIAVAVVGLLILQVTDLATAAEARADASDALARSVSDPQSALALGLRAYSRAPGPRALAAIQSALSNDHEFFDVPLGEPVAAIEFSPDGLWLAALTPSRVVRLDLREAARGAMITMRPEEGRIAALDFVFTPSGRSLLVTAGASDGRVVAWDPATGDAVWSTQVGRVGEELAIVRAGRRGEGLFCASDERGFVVDVDGRVQAEIAFEGRCDAFDWLDVGSFVLGESPRGQPGGGQATLCVIENRGIRRDASVTTPDPILAVHCAPHPERGPRVLLMPDGKAARIWRPAQGDPIELVPQSPFGMKLCAGGWAPDGDAVFVAARGGRVVLFDADGTWRTAIRTFHTISRGVASATRAVFAVNCDLGSAMQLDFSSGGSKLTFGRRRLSDHVLSFSPDGTLLAGVTWKHELVIFRTHDRQLPTHNPRGRLRHASWSADGRSLLVGRDSGWYEAAGAMRAWDPESDRHGGWLAQGLPPIGGAKFTADGRAAVVLGYEVGPVLFEDHDGTWQERARLPIDATLVDSIGFLDDGRVALVRGSGEVGRLEIWDPAAGVSTTVPAADSQGLFDVPYKHWNVAEVAGGGRTLWAGGSPGYLHRFERQQDGSYVEREPEVFGDAILALCLPGDGSLIVAGMNGLLQRRLPSGERLDFWRDSVKVRSLACTQLDGDYVLASGDGQGRVRLWRLDGTLLREMRAHDDIVFQLEFSPDGRRLSSCGRDDMLRTWPTRTEDLLDLARRRLR